MGKDIGQICHDCAVSKGWTPVTMTDHETGEQIPRPVGMWEGECDVCGETKWLCAPRDYVRPGTRPATMEEIVELLYGDSEAPSGDGPEEERPMERLMRYEILVRVSVPLAFDADDRTPDERPEILRGIIAENAMDYISFQAPEEFAADIAEVKLVEDSFSPPIPATYVSRWSDVGDVESACMYDPVTKRVYDIRDSGVVPRGECIDECVRLADDAELTIEQGVTFDY